MNKIVHLADQEELDPDQVREILELDPDLSAAIGPQTEIRTMAEAVIMADNLSNLIYSSDLSSKPTTCSEAVGQLRDQTLEDWVINLQMAHLEKL